MGTDKGSSLDLRLYLVTDPHMGAGRSLLDTVRLALQGGVCAVQLRDKEGCTRDLVEQAMSLRSACSSYGVPLLINDRIDVALACHADGVHIGQDDMPVAVARKLLGPDAIIGVSVRTADDVAAADRDGATYLAANGVWATSTKTDFGAPLGEEGLAALVRASHLPMVAIGGIHAGNARLVRQAGAKGIAVVSAIMNATDPTRAASDLLAAFEA